MQRALLPTLLALGCPAQSAPAVPCHGQNLPVCTFPNDYAGFQTTMAAIGAQIRQINFSTLPDGTPSHPGPIYITPTFNYTAQGATFSTPPVYPFYPFVGGNDQSGYTLKAYSGTPLVRDWLIADLVVPNRAVGIFFPGGTTLYAYDASGALLASVPGGGGASGHFVGIISDAPIARAVQDGGSFSEGMERFVFSPVPEPASAGLLLLGAPLLLGGQRLWCGPL